MDQTPTFQWANEAIPLSLPSKFILPNPIRPDRTCVSHLYSIPIIDMGTDNEAQLIQGITSACKGFGFFQVINHGIPLELCKNVLDMITKLLHLPYEEKSHLVTTTHLEDGKIFKYYVKDQQTQEKISMWAESFFHTWHPHDHGFTHNLPNNPPQYRSVIATYATEVGSLIAKLLGLISRGLGLERDYLKKKLRENLSYTAQANYYPPCPNPELTLGLPAHTDSKVLTILLQEEGVTGLHVLKDGNWVAVDPVPGALVVNVADQLQILSNDRYKSVYHRAVTNEEKKRVSLAMFVGPNHDTVVEPIEELIDENHPALYRRYTFGIGVSTGGQGQMKNH
ncbi:hypothetical protein Cgig2_000151 [Carnegiea gigantea]|uniref:Fe2OG dioxygenase domain-containing protein n=1 Tax=Carnegiea gigantea TaxID=171969 RepID=A0A9Q1GGN1_9CARY|nr:hypothetical protein Cgig2_000151 [Carnegiea gigantea]